MTPDPFPMAIRLLASTCPDKGKHGNLTVRPCPKCGINADDYVRFIAGDVGRRRRAATGEDNHDQGEKP